MLVCLTVLVGAKRPSSLSSSSRAAAESIALWIVALSVKDATARDAVGMVVVSKL
jgi:hypothetical protein